MGRRKVNGSLLPVEYGWWGGGARNLETYTVQYTKDGGIISHSPPTKTAVMD